MMLNVWRSSLRTSQALREGCARKPMSGLFTRGWQGSLAEIDAYIDVFEYCPHHPEATI